jgi:aldose 1-epimerase
MQTDQASVQFYSGNFLDGTLVRKASQCAGSPAPNCTYQRWGAIAIEGQGYPDALHHDNFPPVVLRPGQPYKQSTTYRVFTRNSRA